MIDSKRIIRSWPTSIGESIKLPHGVRKMIRVALLKAYQWGREDVLDEIQARIKP